MPKPLAFVIEDDRNLSMAFAMAVESAEYDVEILNDGRSAIQRLNEAIPTTVILDINIPYITGVEILRVIKADSRFNNTKVIVTTADDRTAERLRDSADLVLVKPVGYHQLKDLATRMRPI
jgi:DNA-binding response OmpR family regulator